MPEAKDDAAFEMILEFANDGDRVFLRSFLDAHGIDYFIQGETAAPYLFHSVPMRLMVRRDQAEDVRALLEDFKQASAYGGLTDVLGDE